jgi:short-subunit dehydrogenase
VANPQASFQTRYGPWAVVAGASEGMGLQFALQLADRDISVVMLARQEARLEQAAVLVRERGVEVRTLAVDLASDTLIDDVAACVGELEIGLLVYNAGLSTQSNFFETELNDHLNLLYVNCRGPVLLAHHFGRAMMQRGRGGILLMSSVAGFVGSGLNAMYASTKAFDIVLGEGLARDLEKRGVDVLSMVAGATRTPQFERSQTGKANAPVMEPADVVREAFDALGTTNFRVAGANKVAAFLLTKLLSRKRASAIMTKASYALSGKRG